MASFNPWTEQDDAELRRLHAKGTSLHGVAGIMGRSKSTISVKSGKLGLSFKSPPPQEAIDAFVFDRRAARARIIQKLYDRAEYLVDTMVAAQAEGGTYVSLRKVGMGEERSHAYTHVPSGDERNLANSIASYLARAEALEKIDADGGMTAAKGMVGSILAAIRDSVDKVPRMNVTKEADPK